MKKPDGVSTLVRFHIFEVGQIGQATERRTVC